MYELSFSNQARKFLLKVDKSSFSLLEKNFSLLLQNPFLKGSKKLTDVLPPTFRIRVRTFRILYTINFDKKEIFVSKIDKRSRVYN